jgi:multidrug efflux pump subunit AcrB
MIGEFFRTLGLVVIVIAMVIGWVVALNFFFNVLVSLLEQQRRWAAAFWSGGALLVLAIFLSAVATFFPN